MRRVLRWITRWLSPTALALAALCFVLPFATVACNTPGGYGRAAPGATTTYTGVDLITGNEPDVGPVEHLRPVTEWRDDRLGAQPLATIVVLLIVMGIIGAVALTELSLRRASVATAAGGALVLLILNQVFVMNALMTKVEEQLTQPLPPGKQMSDFVKTGPGFALCALLLVGTLLANAGGWVRLRMTRWSGEPGPLAHGPPTSHMPTGYVPTSYVPTSHVPAGYIPTSYVPASDVPASQVPTAYPPPPAPAGYAGGPVPAGPSPGGPSAPGRAEEPGTLAPPA